MFLVGILQVHGSMTFRMCTKCSCWEHVKQSVPVLAMFLTCSYLFPGTLAPSENTYPLPIIDELLSKWKRCVCFSALDVQAGYWGVHVKDGDEWKTVFITNHGLYKSLVMMFGLCNAPATFQTMMDSIFVVYIC